MQSTSCITPLASDDELIASARRGEQSGFEGLVRRYQDRLFRSICADVGCPVIAEDVVQDAFVRAFRYLDTFNNQSQFYTWLYRIALNSRRAYIRKHQRTVHLDSIGDSPRQVWTGLHDSPSGQVERTEERKQVRDALSRLPEHHRRILILREFDGLDYRSIAEIMHLNMGTVRSRLARARAMLKTELTAYVKSGPMATSS